MIRRIASIDQRLISPFKLYLFEGSVFFWSILGTYLMPFLESCMWLIRIVVAALPQDPKQQKHFDHNLNVGNVGGQENLKLLLESNFKTETIIIIEIHFYLRQIAEMILQHREYTQMQIDTCQKIELLI